MIRKNVRKNFWVVLLKVFMMICPRPKNSISDKNKLIVVVPTVLFCIHSRFHFIACKINLFCNITKLRLNFFHFWEIVVHQIWQNNFISFHSRVLCNLLDWISKTNLLFHKLKKRHNNAKEMSF